MIELSLRPIDRGILTCALYDGKSTVTVNSESGADATAELLHALDCAGRNGVGECFWPRPAGVYRWLMRRDNHTVRLVVLWSIGTMTGWENCFWSEGEWSSFEACVRREVAAYQAAALAAVDET